MPCRQGSVLSMEQLLTELEAKNEEIKQLKEKLKVREGMEMIVLDL